MKKKQDFSKIALAGFLLAASYTPSAVLADEGAPIQNPANGSWAWKSTNSNDTATIEEIEKQKAGRTSTQGNQANQNDADTMPRDWPKGNWNAPPPPQPKSTYSDKEYLADAYDPQNPARTESYYNSYNTNLGGVTNPTYDNYDRGGLRDINTGANNPNLNRTYTTTNDYDYNQAAATTVRTSRTLTEPQLLGMLNETGRAVYLQLDRNGKQLAIDLASQDSYRDKNLAVKEAQRRMNERPVNSLNRY